MRSRSSLCGLIVAAAAWPATVLADPVRIVLQDRAIVAQVQTEAGIDRTEQAGSDLLTATESQSTPTTTAAAQAMLASSIADPTHLFGTGSINTAITTTSPLLSAALGGSFFTVGFVLDSPHLFDFVGVFSSSGDTGPPGIGAEAVWHAVLIDRSGTLVFDYGTGSSSARPPDVTPLSAAGLLLPGEFYLTANVRAISRAAPGTSAAASGAFTFTLDLTPSETPIPEPGSMWLLGTGLVVLARAARRRTRSTTAG